jgi:hypothetical protein
MRRLLVLLAVAAMACPAVASAHEIAQKRAGFAGGKCEGKEIAADRVVEGRFAAAQQGSYVMIPFTVPDGTEALRVKYCFDQPDSPTSAQVRHTLDLGIWDKKGRLRGWGGSSHPDVTLSPEDFDSPQGTTRAFTPGPLQDGRWAIELGLAAIAGRELGDSDGAVAWRVEVDLIDDPAYADQPYVPAKYSEAPVKAAPGWYAGDLHVHGEHSALDDAPMKEVFDYAFGPAQLDFITLSDYVGGASWTEIGRFQPSYPEKLVVRSAEVITYRGHVNNHASARTVDHRTGPVLELLPDGALKELRGAQPASRLLRDIREAGGVTQLNHVTIFPNEVPAFAFLCRGCPWDYSAEETDWSLVDAIEVATGPGGIQEIPGGLGPNPFTATAVQFYEDALKSGRRIAAVGSSDSHKAGRRDNPVTQAPIGQATTVAYAPELSEAGVACAIKAGHTFVKIWGADRPDLRLEATAPGVAGTAIFGDTIRADGVRLKAEVLRGAPAGGQPYELLVVKDGAVVESRPVTGDALTVEFAAGAPGRYGLRLMRGSNVEAISTPIWVEAPGEMSGSAVVSRPCEEVRQAKLRVARAASERKRAAAFRRLQLRRLARATRRARR